MLEKLFVSEGYLCGQLICLCDLLVLVKEISEVLLLDKFWLFFLKVGDN